VIPERVAARTAASEEATSGTAADDSQLLRLPSIDLESIDHAVAAAIQEALNAVQQSPNSAERWGRLGMVLLAHDFRGRAAECFDRAGQLDSREPRWPHFRARAIRVSQPLQAIPLMEEAISLCVDKSKRTEALTLRLQLAELLIDRNFLDEATPQIKQVLAMDTQNARAHYELGRLAFLEGDFAGCLEELGRAESLGAVSKQGCLLAAEAHRRLGDVQVAEQQRARAAKLPKAKWPDPFLTEVTKLRTGLKARLTMAEYLYGQQKVQASINVLEPTIQAYPDSSWARILLARALIRLRRLSEAEKVLTEALELSPDSVEAHFRMGVTLQLQQRYREASKWFENALQFKPDFAMAHKNLGFCRINLGEFDAAVASVRRAVECQPDFVEGWKTLGQAEEKRGNIEQARLAYQKALTLEPEDRALRERLRLLDVDATFDPSDLEP
jgi:tetratricopeptide (TPR) repeat protein